VKKPKLEVFPRIRVEPTRRLITIMQINDREITESGRDYPYRCYLNTLLYLYQSH